MSTQTIFLPPSGGGGGGDESSISWLKAGNGGTTPGTDFLGTTDNQPLVFKTNSQERFRLTEDGTLESLGDISGISITANQYVDSEFFKCSGHGMAFGYNGSFTAIWTSGNYIYGNPFDDPGSLGGYIGLTTDSGRIGVYGSDVMSWDANYFALSRSLQGAGYNITFDQLGIGYNPGSSENGIFLGAHAIYGSDMGDPANGASIYIDNTNGYLRGASSSDELTWGNGELQANVDINMEGNDITDAYNIYMGGTFSGATYFSVFGAAGTAQLSASVGTAGASTGTDVGWTLDATSTGGIGSTAYTVSDTIYILKSAGFLAM